jgi:hypothetical protein
MPCQSNARCTALCKDYDIMVSLNLLLCRRKGPHIHGVLRVYVLVSAPLHPTLTSMFQQDTANRSQPSLAQNLALNYPPHPGIPSLLPPSNPHFPARTHLVGGSRRAPWGGRKGGCNGGAASWVGGNGYKVSDMWLRTRIGGASWASGLWDVEVGMCD